VENAPDIAEDHVNSASQGREASNDFDVSTGFIIHFLSGVSGNSFNAG
jgi:hypothetical protein